MTNDLDFELRRARIEQEARSLDLEELLGLCALHGWTLTVDFRHPTKAVSVTGESDGFSWHSTSLGECLRRVVPEFQRWSHNHLVNKQFADDLNAAIHARTGDDD